MQFDLELTRTCERGAGLRHRPMCAGLLGSWMALVPVPVPGAVVAALEGVGSSCRV